MEKDNKQKPTLNLHQKLLKIADMAGVLRKDKDGFNYKYVPEDAIQAKITAGMQKYGVMLYPSIVPGSLVVQPYHYDKPKTKKEKDKETGEYKIIDYTVPVNEVIVHAEVKYTWVNTDNPSETIECHWAYIGQMEDASQAFGAGATYGNRYYLLKALQLATTEDDPDAYRSKQKEAEQYEERKLAEATAEELRKAVGEVVEKGSELIKCGFKKEEIMSVVGKYNGGNQNPSSIKSIEVCTAIVNELKTLLFKEGQKIKDTSTKTIKGAISK